MALSAFDDKAHPPQEKELAAVLGKAYSPWKELKKRIAARCSPAGAEWGFTSRSTGWGLRLKHGDQIIIYLTPCQGHFLVSLALGEKAVLAARQGKLSDAILAAIEAAPKYAEGRGVRIPVRTASPVADICALAEIKIAGGAGRRRRSGSPTLL